MNKNIFKFSCPNCRFSVKAELEKKFNKFVLYVCPKCDRNVVYFKEKIRMISDKMVNRLKKEGRLQHCGSTMFYVPSRTQKPLGISKDDIVNLRILLETEQDFNRIIEKL